MQILDRAESHKVTDGSAADLYIASLFPPPCNFPPSPTPPFSITLLLLVIAYFVVVVVVVVVVGSAAAGI